MRPNAIRCQVCLLVTWEDELARPFVEGEPAPPCPHCSDGGNADFVYVATCGVRGCASPFHSEFARLHIEPVAL